MLLADRCSSRRSLAACIVKTFYVRQFYTPNIKLLIRCYMGPVFILMILHDIEYCLGPRT